MATSGGGGGGGGGSGGALPRFVAAAAATAGIPPQAASTSTSQFDEQRSSHAAASSDSGGAWWARRWAQSKALPPSMLPPPVSAQVAASAAAEAAAALSAWKGTDPDGGGPGDQGNLGSLNAAAEEAGTYDDWEEEEEEEEEERFYDPYRPFKLLFAGGVAGAVSRTATAPMDRLKMLLQIQDCQRGLTIKEGVSKMAAEGTIRAFFKGNGTNVVKIAPETAIKLTLNDALKRVVAPDPDEITPAQRMAAGALAGAVAQATIYPFELVRTRLAVCSSGIYAGIADCVRQVAAQEGWRAFYRGMVPSMLGILPYAGVDITIFELLKERLLDKYEGASPPPHMILAAGMCSSSIAQFAAYPLALTRTRLQAQGIGGQPVKYAGMLDVLRKTVQNEGVRGLYKGSLTNLAKVAPAAGISWLVFEQCKAAMAVDTRR